MDKYGCSSTIGTVIRMSLKALTSYGTEWLKEHKSQANAGVFLQSSHRSLWVSRSQRIRPIEKLFLFTSEKVHGINFLVMNLNDA